MENCIKLKIWLMKNKISQSKISRETGLHKNTLSNLLKTGKGSKSVKELTRLYLQINKEEFESLLELD
jgi:transcriptional regulator with XRE-family HTH domain